MENEMATHPEFLPWKSHEQRNLVGYGTWACKELDTTKVTEHAYMHCKYREAGFFCNTFTWMDLKD